MTNLEVVHIFQPPAASCRLLQQYFFLQLIPQLTHAPFLRRSCTIFRQKCIYLSVAGRVVLLRNQVPSRGHWLGLSLLGKPCRDAVGAKLTLEVGGQTLTRFVLGGNRLLDGRRFDPVGRLGG